jgi:prepilin-type N-terminal cleavage/methylation domain-containing protein
MAQKNKNKKGFSLIEVIVTLMVLTSGISAVAVLMTGNINSSDNAKNQIVAAQLAQEGVELVRNLKDNRNAALYGITDGSHDDYRIDEAMANLDTDTFSDKRLYLNANHFYKHNAAGTATKFFRSISLLVEGDNTLIPSTRVFTVTSYVSWNGSGIPATCNIASKCVSVVSVLPDLN